MRDPLAGGTRLDEATLREIAEDYELPLELLCQRLPVLEEDYFTAQWIESRKKQHPKERDELRSLALKLEEFMRTWDSTSEEAISQVVGAGWDEFRDDAEELLRTVKELVDFLSPTRKKGGRPRVARSGASIKALEELIGELKSLWESVKGEGTFTMLFGREEKSYLPADQEVNAPISAAARFVCTVAMIIDDSVDVSACQTAMREVQRGTGRVSPTRRRRRVS